MVESNCFLLDKSNSSLKYYSFDDFCQEYSENADLAKICKSLTQGANENVFASGTDYAKKNKLITSIKNQAPNDCIVTDVDTMLADLIDSLKNSELKKFYEKHEKKQLLVIDGFQFCSGKSSTQEALYTLIKSRLNQSKSTIIFSTRNDFLLIDPCLKGIISTFSNFEF